MGPENFMSVIRRAERRVGRPFLGLGRTEVSAHVLRENGLRVAKDENYGLIKVWEVFFSKGDEAPTLFYGRTLEQAFDRAINPPKPRTRK